jgi:hypothetical protein
VQPRTLLTRNDIRAAGFRPEPGAETIDAQVAHVWYPSTRRGDRWNIGLGVFGAEYAAEADRYWDALVAELGSEDVPLERVAVGEQAVHAEGWLYVRQRGQVLWVAVEGPDPVLARWAVERLARAVCTRVTPLPAAPPAPTAAAAPDAAPAVPAEPVVGPDVLPVTPPPGRARGRRRRVGAGRSTSAAGGESVASGAEPTAAAAGAPVAPVEGDAAADVGAGGETGTGTAVRSGVEADAGVGVGAEAAAGAGGAAGEPARVHDLRKPDVEVEVRPRVTVAGRYPRRHLQNARLAAVGDDLVVTDARGRERRLPRDGTPAAPAAVGLTVDPRRTLGAPATYLAVLDGEGRLLVRDGEAGVWALDDLRRFAAEAGLRYLEPEARADRIDRQRQPIELEGTPWAFLALVAVVVAGGLALGLGAVELPGLAVLGIASALAAVAMLASRRGQVQMTPAAPEPVTDGTTDGSRETA